MGLKLGTKTITGVRTATDITSSQVVEALGYTPYDSSNPNGYITGITSSDVTTALGFTPQKDIIKVTKSSFSSLPQTITNSNITSDHVVIQSYLSNPEAQAGVWTVTTSDGSLTISGTILTTTSIALYLA